MRYPFSLYSNRLRGFIGGTRVNLQCEEKRPGPVGGERIPKSEGKDNNRFRRLSILILEKLITDVFTMTTEVDEQVRRFEEK
jgi:hypothetical protein